MSVPSQGELPKRIVFFKSSKIHASLRCQRMQYSLSSATVTGRRIRHGLHAKRTSNTFQFNVMLCFPTADYVYKMLMYNFRWTLLYNCVVLLLTKKTCIDKKLIKSQMQLVGQKLKILFLLSYIQTKKLSLFCGAPDIFLPILWKTNTTGVTLQKNEQISELFKISIKNLCKKPPLKNWGGGSVIFCSPIVLSNIHWKT